MSWIVAVLASAGLFENIDGKYVRESCLVIALRASDM